MMSSASAAAPSGASMDPGSGYNSPRNTLSSVSGIVVAVNEALPQDKSLPTLGQPMPLLPTAAATSSALPFDEEAKLVFGVIFSLRNMIKKLSGRFVYSSVIPRCLPRRS